VHRSEKYFHDAKNFHPERWLPKTHPLYETIYDNDQKGASNAFSMGPRGCLGINLAYLQIRIVLARIILQFDWELVNKDIDFERETRVEVLWKKPALMVKYTPIIR
jgi:cytochrome P450